jgi:hypothetical protein
MNQTLGILNAIVQIAAILSYQYLALVWPLYFVMLMLALLIFVQTISASAVFARVSVPPSKDKNEDTGGALTLLVAVLYFMSAYHIHLLGYTVFATIAAAHITIMMFSAFFMWIKK